MFSLSGQTAIVTGAAAGIGEAIAIRLASAGARVAVLDLNLSGAESVAARLPNASFAVEVDVSRATSVRDAVSQVVKMTGCIDILVNNAGIAGPAAFVWEQTDEDWQRNIAVNLTGVFNLCRTVIPYMRERGYGRCHWIDESLGKRTRHRRRVCQRSLTSSRTNPDSRSAYAGTGDLHDRPHPDEASWKA
jgi:NAD(P)-dependent dehydrogenase (short-subunit alcohol dehydrogenase family)